MTKKEKAKKEIKDLIGWLYKSSYVEIFEYNRINQTKDLSPLLNERVDKFINNFVKS